MKLKLLAISMIAVFILTCVNSAARAAYPQTMTTNSPLVNLPRPDEDPRWAKAFAHWDKREDTEEVEAAIKIFEELAKAKPDSYEARLWLSRANYLMSVRKRGDKAYCDKGIAAGDAALKIKPGDYAATIWRFSSLLLSRNFTEEEYKVVEELGKKHRALKQLPTPDDDPLWAEAVKKYEARKDIKQAKAAIEDFKKLDAKDPKRIEAKMYIAWTYFYLGLAEPSKEAKADLFKQGGEWALKAKEIEPRNPTANYAYCATMGSYAEHADMFAMVRYSMDLTNSLIIVCEEDPTHMYGGFSRFLAGSLAEAGELSFRVAEMLGFSKELIIRLTVYSTKQEPGYFDNHVRLAQMYLSIDKKEEAKKSLEFVINGDPAMLEYYEPENIEFQEKAKEVYNEHFK